MSALNVVSILSDVDIVAARMAARDAARAIGFGAVDQARIATATSELTRNIVVCAGEGSVTISRLEVGGRRGIEIVFHNTGPAMVDHNQPFQEDVTRNGFGVGVSAARRLMDELELQNITGMETIVICRKWLR